jgi:hypothetical protein
LVVLVYIHIPKEKRTKLEPSSLKGIFVGYNETSKAYKVYIPSQQKIVVSQDVKFDKDGSSKSQEPPTEIEEVEKLAAPKVDPQILGKSSWISQVPVQVQRQLYHQYS